VNSTPFYAPTNHLHHSNVRAKPLMPIYPLLTDRIFIYMLLFI
jgi:hypothetical protein